jgi:hypothetical protein
MDTWLPSSPISDCPQSNLHRLVAGLIQRWPSSSARRNSSREQSSRLVVGQHDNLIQSGPRLPIFCETTDGQAGPKTRTMHFPSLHDNRLRYLSFFQN